MMSSWIYEFVDLFLQNEASAALLTTEGDVLHAKSDRGFEVTGFKNIADSALKYIALKPGEILVTNDPYSGGSFLHCYSFLMPLTANDGAQPGLILCVRRQFAAGLNVTDKIDNEGLRIPPTPIFQNAQLIEPIIQAMSMHPLCPRGFSAWLQQTSADLSALGAKWNSVQKSGKLAITATDVKKFLNFSKDYVTEKIFEKAQGEARTEIRLDSGELLKLHLEIANGVIKADFSGTSTGIKNHLPDLATFGACYDSIARFYGLRCFTNSGSFALLQVTKPLGCFLNAKYPASTHQGLQTGIAAVQTAMNLALHQIVKSADPLISEVFVKIEMAFGDDRRWLSTWSAKACCESLSIEKIETQFPVQFVKLEKNHEKMHLEVEIKTLAACQMRWLSDFTKHSLKAPKGLSAPEPAKIEILTTEGTWNPLASQGAGDVAPGSHLRISLSSLFSNT